MKAQRNGERRPRSDYWRDLIEEQERSGMTVQAFCAERRLTEASFYHWRKQLRNTTPVSFALVDHNHGSKPAMPVEVTLASGDRVQVAPGTDAVTLRMVLAVLRERA